MNLISLTPFDKVLVRDKEYELWRPDIFFYEDKAVDPYRYCCSKQNWKYCIKYEGNETLNGKSDLPYKEYNFNKGEVGLFSHDGKTWHIAIFVRKEGPNYITTDMIKHNVIYSDELAINSWVFAKPYNSADSV